MQPGDYDVAVYRDFSLSGMSHRPSAGELESDEWEVFDLPAGVEERTSI